jgi:hypothetical protein
MKFAWSKFLKRNDSFTKSIEWEKIYNSIYQAITNITWPKGSKTFYLGENTRRKTSSDGNGVNFIKQMFIENLISSGDPVWIPEDVLNINWTSESNIDRIREIKSINKSRVNGTLLHGKLITYIKGKLIIELANGVKDVYSMSPYAEIMDINKNTSDITKLIGKNISFEARNPGQLDAGTHLENGKIFCVEWETGNISSSHRSLNKICLGIMNGVLEGGALILPTKEMYYYLTDRVGNFEELLPYFPFWETQNIDGTLIIIAVQHDGVAKNIPLLPKGKDGMADK